MTLYDAYRIREVTDWLAWGYVIWLVGWCSDGQLCRLCGMVQWWLVVSVVWDGAVTVSCVRSEFSHNAQKLSPGLDSVTWTARGSQNWHVVECRMSRHTHHTVYHITHISTTYCLSHVTLHFSQLTRQYSDCYCNFVFWVQVLISNRICWLRGFKSFPGVSGTRHRINSLWA